MGGPPARCGNPSARRSRWPAPPPLRYHDSRVRADKTNGGNVAGRFVDALACDDARAAFRAWCRLRRSDGAPPLSDLAPFGLPPAVVPHILLYRQMENGDLLCTLAGD